jgi:hypothetical protein
MKQVFHGREWYLLGATISRTFGAAFSPQNVQYAVRPATSSIAQH